MTDRPLWSVPLRVEDVPEEGQDVTLVADANTRSALARTAGVVGLPRLEAHFRVRRHGRDGLRVDGTVSATVEQTCVVTLEPLTNEVAEAVDVIFDPAVKDAPLAGEEESVHLGQGEPPEPLIGGAIDLGALATEFLLLGIDPYPRKPGAVFSPPPVPDDTDSRPFAALASLKKPSKGSS